jgi:hypothetical protein
VDSSPVGNAAPPNSKTILGYLRIYVVVGNVIVTIQVARRTLEKRLTCVRQLRAGPCSVVVQYLDRTWHSRDSAIRVLL